MYIDGNNTCIALLLRNPSREMKPEHTFCEYQYDTHQ